jgi:hypothetical protein
MRCAGGLFLVAVVIAEGSIACSSSGAGARSEAGSDDSGNTSQDGTTAGVQDATTTGMPGPDGSVGSTSDASNPPEASLTTSDGGATDSGATADDGGCTPAVGIPYSYACWPMPNPASAGLPNPASYTDQGNGTVKDTVTGLIWQQAVAKTQAYTWTGAQAYCQSLTLAGLTWRLPTRIELLSIVDFTRTSPAIDTTAFTNTPGAMYTWTNSPWVVSQIATKAQLSWIVNFYEGLTSNAGDRTATEYARCVSSSRGGPLPKLYTEVATGEEQDAETGLIWQQDDSGTTMAFTAAAPYCASLALNGHTWRVPSIKELSTLVDEDPPISKVSPAIDTTTFPSTAASTPYWSSSLFDGEAATTHDPWVINFEDGFTEYNQTAALVRCVR